MAWVGGDKFEGFGGGGDGGPEGLGSGVDLGGCGDGLPGVGCCAEVHGDLDEYPALWSEWCDDWFGCGELAFDVAYECGEEGLFGVAYGDEEGLVGEGGAVVAGDYFEYLVAYCVCSVGGGGVSVPRAVLLRAAESATAEPRWPSLGKSPDHIPRRLNLSRRLIYW